LPCTIKIVADTLWDENRKSNSLDRSLENEIRDYAISSDDLAPWTLTIPPPADGSACITTHKVNVTTPILGLVISEKYTSPPFIYGDFGD